MPVTNLTSKPAFSNTAKSYIRALSVDSVTSDAFQQDGLPFAACASAHVQLRGRVDGAVTDAALIKNRCC